MTPPAPFSSKTISAADFADPHTAAAAGELRRFALGLWLRGTKFAVNGFLRWRFWLSRYKLWEYARGVAAVRQAARPGGCTVLDFGGGATPPVLLLARDGCGVLSLDIDPQLAAWTSQLGERYGWRLRGSTHDLTQAPLPAPLAASVGAGQGFDAAMTFSVLEHIPTPMQRVAVARLGESLRPGGLLALTIDYGEDAPAPFAARNPDDIAALVAASGCAYAGPEFFDTGERFALDRRNAARGFTFASLFLRKP